MTLSKDCCDVKIKNFHCSVHGYVKPTVEPKCPHPHASSKEEKSWEEEFDAKFVHTATNGIKYITDILGDGSFLHASHIKSFITNLLESERERAVSEVVKYVQAAYPENKHPSYIDRESLWATLEEARNITRQNKSQ